MRESLRSVLADSHVAAVAIAALLAGFISLSFTALIVPAAQLSYFLTIALATHDVPYMPRAMIHAAPSMSIQTTISQLCFAVNSLACAWLLSLWTYGTGPLRSLGNYREGLSRKKDA